MLKVAFFQGVDDSGPRVIPLFSPADAVFEKTAAPKLLPDVAKYIAGLKPSSDSQYVLLNAMGAVEWWGSNVNGDGFTEASLIHKPDDWTGNPLIDKQKSKDWAYGFPTFYFAHPYCHHRNKDTTRAFGEVELAAWNPAMKRVELVTRVDKDKCEEFGGIGVWDKLKAGEFPDVSMGCAPPGTRITLWDGSFKNIENVIEGDVVLSHRGAFRRVTTTMQRRYEGRLYQFKVYGFPRVLPVTDEHPLWLVRAEQLTCAPTPAQVNAGRHQRHCTPLAKALTKGCAGCRRPVVHDFTWTRADQAEVGDYLAFPVPTGQSSDISSLDEARLLGYYLAEGHVGNYNDRPLEQITFSLNFEEKEIAADIEATAHRLGAQVVWHDERPEKGGRYVHVVHQVLAQKCRTYCGAYAKEKRVSHEVLFMPKELQLAFLGAYLDGDGGTYQGAAYFSTSSEQLAHQLFVMLARCGLIASVNTLEHHLSEKSVVCKDTTECRVWVGTDFSPLIGPFTRKPIHGSLRLRGQRFFYEHEGIQYLMAPILEVEERAYDSAVFNFSVEEDESYVAEGLATHNCKVPFDTCFPAGTLVRSRIGHVPIEAVRVGDEVLTHKGLYRPVQQVMSRSAEGLVHLEVSGLPSIESTENHPFLVVRREQARGCKGTVGGRRVRHTPDAAGACRRCGTAPPLEAVWAAAETLRPGDYLAVPRGQTKAVDYDASPSLRRARLLGYYLGDGYVITQKTGKKKDGPRRDMGVGFSVGSHEEAHLSWLLRTLVEAGAANEPCVYDAGCDRKAYIVSVYDQELASWVQQFGGRTSHGKELTSAVFSWTEEAKLELVAGYIETDGSFDAASGSMRVPSVNRGLLLDVQRLLLSMGITATVCRFAKEGAGGYMNSSEAWALNLSAFEAQRFFGRTTKVQKREVGWDSPQSFFYGDYWLTPVRSVEELEAEVEVYNLSVDVDESYVAEGRAVHNCSICLDWDTYRRAQGMYRPDRHASPGQAVLAYHKELIKKNGHGIRGVSITRKDYCSHASKQMNQILPDGRKVFVFNDYPKFFDISFVFIGADKTAKVMLKIAGGGQVYWFLNGAELAEKLGYTQNDDLLLSEFAPQGLGSAKTASVTDETLKQAFLGKLAKNKDAEIVKDVIPSQFVGKAVPLLTRHEQDLPKSILEALSVSPLEESLSTTAGMGIVLRPREFQHIILIQMGKRPLAERLESEDKVFPKSDETAEMPMGPECFSQVLARLLLPMMAERSGIGPSVERRVLVVAGDPKEKHGGSSSLSTGVLRKMGAAYNGYRVGLMELVTHIQELIPSMAMPPSEYLCKLAMAPVESIFTPLSAGYFKLAFWDELGAESPATVERGLPSRNTSAIRPKVAGGY